MNYSTIEQIYDDFARLNDRLRMNDLWLSLNVVGGAGLIFNGVKSHSTDDIDTLSQIEEEVKVLIDDLGLDINNDVLDYLSEFDGLEFIEDNGETFSNISIMYLELGGVVKTKMGHDDDVKLDTLRHVLEHELNVELTVDGLHQFFEDEGVDVDDDLIKHFLRSIDYLEED